jgi:hypothetical protein
MGRWLLEWRYRAFRTYGEERPASRLGMIEDVRIMTDGLLEYGLDSFSSLFSFDIHSTLHLLLVLHSLFASHMLLALHLLLALHFYLCDIF